MPMNTAKLLLLNVLGGSAAAPVTYLFRDEFTTDEAAPLASPRTAEPGPGTAVITGDFSIASGNFLFASAGGGMYVSATPFARVPGRILRMNFKYAINYVGFGWSPVSGWPDMSEHSVYISSGLNTRPDAAFAAPLPPNTYSTCAIVLQTTGALFFNNGMLEWVYVRGTTTPLYVQVASFSAPVNITIDSLHIFDLPAPFTTDYGIATLNVASPVDATEYTGDADGIIDLTVTAPGSLDGSASTRCGFYYRADADLSPAWHCYVDGTGAFNLDSIDAAGTRTNRITAAGVITGGATRTLRVICAGTKHNAYSLSGTTWAKHGAEITLSLNDAVTTIEPSVPAGWTAVDLRSYPRTSPAYAELDRT